MPFLRYSNVAVCVVELAFSSYVYFLPSKEFVNVITVEEDALKVNVFSALPLEISIPSGSSGGIYGSCAWRVC